ncbi:acyl-CoA-binding domain-containing protein 4 isoform X3 [Diceros bicornis minor]|uniref:acyl-CoA-binding domain-containing protein 4 isoform X3 n=1 Tax=Diceros bicornis minor TaxID=77932 RepID=UPI0026ECD109|nr:acyl-CoA-binding domain-containing protein 4 isoform X3 [Diceros bicornis minor]
MKAQNRTARNSSRRQSASFRTCLRMALTAPPTKRCYDSTATTSRLPWGPAWSPGLGSGTPLDDISALCPSRDAWNSLGKMSREEAMSAYITEMKLVAQKVIDTVPLGEVAEDMFGYFKPLYQVIPDMPRPPETFLRKVTGCKEQVLNGDAGAAPEPSCLPEEPAPPNPESQPPRDLDSEFFSDSLEQLEPELVWAEQRGALGGEPDSRNSPVPPREKEGLEGSLLGPQELDTWLMGTVRALQESMQEVQGRLQSLESMPSPPKQDGVAQVASREVKGSEVLLPWKGEREGPSFPAVNSLCLKRNSLRTNSNSLEGPGCVCSLHWGWRSLLPLCQDFCSQI